MEQDGSQRRSHPDVVLPVLYGACHPWRSHISAILVDKMADGMQHLLVFYVIAVEAVALPVVVAEPEVAAAVHDHVPDVVQSLSAAVFELFVVQARPLSLGIHHHERPLIGVAVEEIDIAAVVHSEGGHQFIFGRDLVKLPDRAVGMVPKACKLAVGILVESVSATGIDDGLPPYFLHVETDMTLISHACLVRDSFGRIHPPFAVAERLDVCLLSHTECSLTAVERVVVELDASHVCIFGATRFERLHQFDVVGIGRQVFVEDLAGIVGGQRPVAFVDEVVLQTGRIHLVRGGLGIDGRVVHPNFLHLLIQHIGLHDAGVGHIQFQCTEIGGDIGVASADGDAVDGFVFGH